jgi:hypothetical protein
MKSYKRKTKILSLVIIYLALVLLPKGLYAQDCFETSILSPTPFMGNDGEIFKLVNGSIWEVKYEYEYLYEYYPNVIICPDRGKLIINDKSLSIELLSSASNETPSNETVIESQIDGDFNGFEGETIIKLMNGQIWQQSEYWYHYHYAFMPKVLIYKSSGNYKIKVDGVDKSIGVVRLR